VDHLRDDALPDAGSVEVFDAEQHAAAPRAGGKPGPEERAEIADVERSGGARRQSADDAHLGSGALEPAPPASCSNPARCPRRRWGRGDRGRISISVDDDRTWPFEGEG